MKVIESNVAYEIIEIPGRINREIEIIPTSPKRIIRLTPYGAADLARRLLNWAANQDNELGKRYPSFTGIFGQRM